MPTTDTIKRALVIGIDHYPFAPLSGCVHDATEMTKMLKRNGDENETLNFDCETVLSKEGQTSVTTEYLRARIQFHLKKTAGAQVIYFSGHGSNGLLGGYLNTQDATQSNPGISFKEIVKWVNDSNIPQITIILDCCHSGLFGLRDTSTKAIQELNEGVSILASSLPTEVSKMDKQGSLFTNILLNGLKGQAADILGRISVASLYNQADSLLSSLEQRPMIKAHLSRMAVLRKVRPALPQPRLRKIQEYFTSEDFEFRLSPAYEPTEEPIDAIKEAIFADLQAFEGVGLVRPVGEKHMYYAALNSKACGLTDQGKFYWNLVRLGML